MILGDCLRGDRDTSNRSKRNLFVGGHCKGNRDEEFLGSSAVPEVKVGGMTVRSSNLINVN